MDPNRIRVKSVKEFKEFADRSQRRLEAARSSIYVCLIYSACLYFFRMLGCELSEMLMIFGLFAAICAYIGYSFYKDEIKDWLLFHQNMYKFLKFSFIKESGPCPNKVKNNGDNLSNFRRHSYPLGKRRILESSIPVHVNKDNIQEFFEGMNDVIRMVKVLNAIMKEITMDFEIMTQNLKSVSKNLMDFGDTIKVLGKCHSCHEIKLNTNISEDESKEFGVNTENVLKSQDFHNLAITRRDCMETKPSTLLEEENIEEENIVKIKHATQEDLKLHTGHLNKLSCSEGDLSDNTRSSTRSSGGSTGLLLESTNDASSSRTRFQETASTSQHKAGRFWKSFRNAVTLWSPRVRYSVPRVHVKKKYSSLTLLRN